MGYGRSIPLLDAELLRAYEDRLRSQGLPLDRLTNPGLTISEIENVLSPLGLRLPSEGREWWGWHNGENDEGRGRVIGPWRRFLSLEKSVKVYRELRPIAEELAEPGLPPPLDDPDFRWNPAWLPIKGPQLPFVIDCSVAEGEPTPIRMLDWQNVDEFFRPRADSFGQMVQWWIDAIDAGAWRWNPERNQWDTHDELLGPELRINPLV